MMCVSSFFKLHCVSVTFSPLVLVFFLFCCNENHQGFGPLYRTVEQGTLRPEDCNLTNIQETSECKTEVFESMDRVPYIREHTRPTSNSIPVTKTQHVSYTGVHTHLKERHNDQSGNPREGRQISGRTDSQT